jgi:M6 family metalloprotease-like protein
MGLAAAMLVAAPLAAQYPRAQVGQFEVRGFDFATDGAWRRTATRVMDARRALLRAGNVALLNSPSSKPVVRGTYYVPVIPIGFRDTPPPFPASAYQDLFFSANPAGRAWSVKTYYTAASRGNVVLDGHVFDWVRVDSNAAYYQDGCNGIGVLGPCPAHVESRMYQLLDAALDSVSNGPGGDTVWNRYDNDGPDGIPNSGDDDGVIDVVAFLQPAVDGACGAPGIWSHRGTFDLWNNGKPYVTRTPRRDASGQPIPGQFLVINSYTIQSAVGGDAACNGAQIMPVGTVTHETGHAFGLPDLYDTDPLSATQGAGEWSLMSSGTYAQPYSPSSFDAWSLVQLGWVRVDTLASGDRTTAPPVQTSNTVYYAGTDGAVYFLLENRGNVGTDTAQMNPTFAHAKSPGLLLWEIDDARVAQGALPVNRVNTGPHQGVALIQADGLDQLRTPFGGNRGDTGDSYPGRTGNHAFGLSTFPTALDWSGAPLGIRLDQITALPDGSVTFRYTHGMPTVVAAVQSTAQVRVNGAATGFYREVLAPGDTLLLSVDTSQVSFDGRSLSRFVGWSDGGLATHRIVVGVGPPDTVRAAFSVSNRLRVTVSGPGTVASNIAGALGAGAFVALGQPAQLIATPNAGAEFIGWRGDTTGGATLQFPMAHAYDLTAVFLASVAVDPTVAARAVLGGPPLDAASAAYLDAIGNQNGVYDIGDYVAWLRRTGQHAPVELRRVKAAP